jgi:hypothetical protein
VSLAKATRDVPELLPEPDHGVVVGDVQQGSSRDILQTGKQTPCIDNEYSSQRKMSKKISNYFAFLQTVSQIQIRIDSHSICLLDPDGKILPKIKESATFFFQDQGQSFHSVLLQ